MTVLSVGLPGQLRRYLKEEKKLNVMVKIFGKKILLVELKLYTSRKKQGTKAMAKEITGYNKTTIVKGGQANPVASS